MNCYTVPSQGREGHKILSCGQRKKTVSDHHLVHNDNCVVPMNHAWLIIFTKQLGFCSICSSRKLLPPGQYALSTEYHVAYRYNHLTPPSADLLKSAMMRDGTKTGPWCTSLMVQFEMEEWCQGLAGQKGCGHCWIVYPFPVCDLTDCVEFCNCCQCNS